VLDPVFVESAGGRILCTVFRPAARHADSPGLLFLPPWAEEANKARRMIARLGHALAERGVVTLVPDYLGTGDSEGAFEDARWELWRRNVRDAEAWMRADGCDRVHLGGLRLGAALALASLSDLPAPPRSMLLWQPVVNGRQMLVQFLRLRLAASLGGGTERETTSELRARLDAGESVEVAGYMLSPELAQALDGLRLDALTPAPGVPVEWLELAATPDAEVSPAARSVAEAWLAGGFRVRQAVVAGEPFWSTQELVDAPALIERSVAVLAEHMS